MDEELVQNPEITIDDLEKTAAEGSAVSHNSALAPPRFRSQWDEVRPSFLEINSLPSCTIPDQSMTISEIIARFTRSGIMPVRDYSDDGGNMAPDDPEFDPLDFDPEFIEAEKKRLQEEVEKAKVAQESGTDKDAEFVNKDAPDSQ